MKNRVIFLYLISTLLLCSSTVYSQEVKIKTIDEIIKELKIAVTQSPNDTMLYILLGDAYVEKGLPESAQAEYEKVLKMNSENIIALTKVGELLLKKEETEDAKEKFSKVLESEKGSGEHFYAKGLEHEFNLRYSAAIEEYSRAVGQYDVLTRVYKNLGVIEGMQGNTEKGIEYFQKTLEIKDALVKVYSHLGLVYRRAGDIDYSVATYQKAIEIKPDDEALHLDLGLSYLMVDSLLEDAVETLKKSIELDSTNSEVHYKLGMVYGRLGKLGHHIWELQKAVELNPENAQAHVDLAVAYFSNRQYLSSWEQVKEAERLGYQVSKDFLEVLGKALPRPKD